MKEQASNNCSPGRSCRLGRATRRLAAGCVLLILSVSVWGSSGRLWAELAAWARVAEDIRYLASEELEGRGPGTVGREKAAEYLRDEFARGGLRGGAPDGSFFQPIEIPLRATLDEAATRLVLRNPAGEPLALERELEFQPLAAGGSGRRQAELVFAGYGISAPDLGYDDYQNLDVQDKIVLILRRQPQQQDADSAFGGATPSTHAGIRNKLERAKQQGAAAVLLVNDPFTTERTGSDALVATPGFGMRSAGIPLAQLSQAVVERMLETTPVIGPQQQELSSVAEVAAAIDQNLQPLSQPLAGWSAELELVFESTRVPGANVIGVLEGAGPRAEETVVLGGHYDHLGYGEQGSRRPETRAIHPGADDNASGTAVVLDLARRFAAREAPPPRRLVFVAFDGEERGLIGSRAYVENPPFPLENTLAMLNFDMVGRLRENQLTLTGLNTALEFESLFQQANETVGLRIRRWDRISRMSDHYDFYEQGIPVLHFFTGMTDEYHTPDDTFDTLNMDGVLQITDLAERFLDLLLAAESLTFVPREQSGDR